MKGPKAMNIQENEEVEQPRTFKPLQVAAEMSPLISKNRRKSRAERKAVKE